ncbi:MAG: site-specific DNA-methyltransferase [Phycisphaerae bacterium]
MTAKLDRIVQGDCIKKLNEFDKGSVDLVFADPPFNIGYDYDEYDDKRSCEDYLDWSRQWISQVIRMLKPDGTFWLAIGDEYAAELKVMTTRELGLTCRSWVVWYYTFGVHCKYKFARSHAHLFYFVRDPKKFTFNADAVRVPSARQLVYGDRRANPKGRVPDDTWIIAPSLPPLQGGTEGGTSIQNRDRKGAANPQSAIPNPQSTIDNRWILRPQDLPEGFTADSDTWYFPRVCGTFKERTGFHGCQMPEQLLGRIINACSNEGDLVLDPFIGSGTTLAVAKKLGRRYLGIELSKEYVNKCCDRLRRIEPGDPLDGVEDPLTSVAKTEDGIIRTPDGKRVKRDGSPKRRGRPRPKVDQMKLWE